LVKNDGKRSEEQNSNRNEKEVETIEVKDKNRE
jgi:hypothetical protein